MKVYIKKETFSAFSYRLLFKKPGTLQDEVFYQEFKQIENSWKRNWEVDMMADYSHILKRKINGDQLKKTNTKSLLSTIIRKGSHQNEQ